MKMFIFVYFTGQKYHYGLWLAIRGWEMYRGVPYHNCTFEINGCVCICPAHIRAFLVEMGILLKIGRFRNLNSLFWESQPKNHPQKAHFVSLFIFLSLIGVFMNWNKLSKIFLDIWEGIYLAIAIPSVRGDGVCFLDFQSIYFRFNGPLAVIFL